MKIAIITDVYKPVINGVVVSIDNFAKGLIRLGHEPLIFAPGYKGYKDSENYVYRFKLTKKIPANYRLYIPISPKIGNLINGCDIIHVQHPFVSGVMGLYRSKLHKIPLVFTHHTMYEDYTHYVPLIGKLEGFKGGLRMYVTGFCNLCDCIIAPTESIKKMLIKEGVNKKIVVIPTGIDLERFEKADGRFIRKKYNIKEPIILYVGRIAEEKNVGFLLKIFKEVLKERNVKFIVVGDGEQKSELEEKYKEVKDIIFTGKTEDVAPYYKAADIFASASKTETQGLVFLEAKASGLAVVAFDATGSRDMIANEKDGFLVKSEKEFKEKLLKLIDDKKLRKKMSANAIKNSKKYSVLETSKNLLKVYESLKK